jgi:UDP-N-acetylmuramate--alanine ligase
MLRGNTFFSNYELDEIFKSAKNIFFIGIGGVSMSSLAEYCYFNGKTVFGYDRERGENARRLEKICNIKYYSTPDNVSSMDMVIYSTSIDTSNFEMQRAHQLEIPLVSRANFLGYVMSKNKNRIGICGTHGKSTVTSMVAHIFEYACKNPTVFCGAVMKEFCSTSKLGADEDFIFEACEYQNSFHNFCPTHVIVTNIEYDHPDFFENEEELFSSFQKFVKISDVALVNLDDARASQINHERKITFGINKNADYTASDIRVEKGRTLFSVNYHGAKICECNMAFFGTHMVYNALSAIAFCHLYGINSTIIERAISSYTGIKRRAELIKRMKDKDIYLDYAHHPTEIKASLDGFRCMGYKKILVIFQSHTYSRTIALYGEFVSSLKMADELVIAPIYEAREINESGYSDKDLASDTGAEYIDGYEAICEIISKSDSDCAVIMGAGDIEKIKKFLK